MTAPRGRKKEQIVWLLFPPAVFFGHVTSHRIRAFFVAGVIALALAGWGSQRSAAAGWPLPNLDQNSTRAAVGSGIDRKNVGSLHLVWRYRFQIPPGYSGADTATPVVADGVVYLQNMFSNVIALDLKTGAVRWRAQFDDTNQGPDGVTVVGDKVYGATDTTVFALSTSTGRLLWTQRLAKPLEQFVNIAPQVANGIVYAATIGEPPGGEGHLYAIDAKTGKMRWRFNTIKSPWKVPFLAAGGGAWYTPSVAGNVIYWGIANPLPWGGSRKYPNGAAFAGPALYTDSLLALNATTGKLLWYDQVTTHDVRDHDFQLPPILGFVGKTPAVFGGGKGGVVIAWNRATHKRIWESEVGVHRNDAGPLPTHRVLICPGLLGGILTPMAYAQNTLFVPVVDLCMRGSATGYEDLGAVNVTKRGKGEFVAIDAATGRHIWTRKLPQPDFSCATVANGVVFTATYDGSVYGLDTATGATLWRAQTPSRINSCPALAGDTLLVGAGVAKGKGVRELEAFRP
jgi:outer membrane protein assembly factor BamB